MRILKTIKNKAKQDFFKLVNKNKNIYYTKKHEYITAYKKAKNIITNIDKIALLRGGNSKLQENIFSWGIVEGMTCMGGKLCQNIDNKDCCYCLQSSCQYSNTRIMRLYKTMLSCYFSNLCETKQKQIFKVYLKQLEHASKIYKHTYIRVHDSGEIYNNKYKQFILNFAKYLEEIQSEIIIFLYTKTMKQSEINYINKKYNNIKINNSWVEVAPNTWHVNYFNKSEIKLFKQFLKYNKNKKISLCTYKLEKHADFFKVAKKINKKQNNILIDFEPCGICTNCMRKDIDITVFLEH